MPVHKEFEIAQKFLDHVDRGDITEDMTITYQIAGGIPSQQVEEELRLSGNGNTKVMVRDVLRSIPAQEVSLELDRTETRDVFQKIVPGLYSLVPRSEAHFPPDSLVGSITFQVGGEEAKLYFLANERDRMSQNKPIAPQATEAIQNFKGISERLLVRGRQGKP